MSTVTYIGGINLYMSNIYQMHVKQHYFDLLEAGTKLVEFRLNDEKRKSIKVGDKICFVCQNDESKSVVLSVSDIVFSSAFAPLIGKVTPNFLGGISPQEQLKELNEIYADVSVNKYGVLALILERAI